MPFQVSRAGNNNSLVIVTSELRLEYNATANAHDLTGVCNFDNHTDVGRGIQIPGPHGARGNMTQTTCCEACEVTKDCKFWIFAAVPVAKTGYNCWLMSRIGSKVNSSDRVLGYKVTKPPFAHDSLSIEIAASKHTWHFGDVPSQNLGGTISSWNEVSPGSGAPTLQPGLLSKAGWSLIEDNAPSPGGQDPYVGGATARFVDGDADPHWVDGSPWLATPDRTPGDGFDGYFFGCGDKFRECLGDWSVLSGPVPLPPKRTCTKGVCV